MGDGQFIATERERFEKVHHLVHGSQEKCYDRCFTIWLACAERTRESERAMIESNHENFRRAEQAEAKLASVREYAEKNLSNPRMFKGTGFAHAAREIADEILKLLRNK